MLQSAQGGQNAAPQARASRPNVILFCSDQMRSDFVGAYNENSMTRTPTVDGMVRRGSSFKYAVTNQPAVLAVARLRLCASPLPLTRAQRGN